MTYQLRFPDAAATLYDALRGDPFYDTLEAAADPGRAREAMLGYLDYSLVESDTHGIASFYPTDYGMGAAAWRVPLEPSLTFSMISRSWCTATEKSSASSRP